MRGILAFRRFLSLFLLTSLLANQVFAVSGELTSVWQEQQQNLSYKWRMNGYSSFWQKNSPGKTETQEERDARVAKIIISPDPVTAQPGEKLIFQASALDLADAPIAGVKFDWSVNDEGRKEPARISQQGEFVSLVAGTFKVTASALGRSANIIVKVVGEDFKPKKPEEIPTGVVSSRDLPKIKSETSMRFSTTVNTQVASLATKSAQPKSLTKHKQGTWKAASTALTAATAFQIWGDPYGWTDLNYMTADDCGKEVGDMPGRPQNDGEVGSGNYQFTAPVLNLPGRGMNLALGLSYNSRLWHKAGNEITFDIDRNWPAPGFSLGFGKIVQGGLSHGFILIDGDGTRHGYSCQSTSTGMSCFTNDGTFIDYEVVASSSSYPVQNAPISATAKLPNGTTITYGAPSDYAVYPTKIMDAHGNYMTISYIGNQGPAIQTITDTLGRSVNFYYDSSYTGIPPLLTSITAPDFNGGTRTLVRLQYTDQTLSYGYTTNPTPKVRGGGQFKMLKAIYYPATATGYWFGNGVGSTGSYSSYGMLLNVIEQRNMTFNNAAMNSQGVIGQGTMSRETYYAYNSPTTAEPSYTEMREKWAGMETAAGTPGYDSATSSVKTTYQIIEEPSSFRRAIRLTRPDGTIQVQWQRVLPGGFDDGLIFFDKTCAPGTPCAYDDGGLRASSTTWQSGYNGAPRPTSIFVMPRPWTGTAFAAGNYTLTTYTYGYLYNNRPTLIEEFGYAASALRSTAIQYEYGGLYVDRHIFGLPKVVEVKEGTTVKQKTEYVYDNNAMLYDTPSCTQRDASCDPQNYSYDPMSDYRGLVTMIKRYPNPANTTGLITETRTYDEAGNLRTANTSCCEQMTYVYDSSTQFAYPTTQKRGHATNSALQVSTNAAYNLNTALPTSRTDANTLTTLLEYEQSAGSTVGTLRLKKETLPTGACTEYTYNDTNLTITTETRLSAGGAIAAKSVKTLDGVGRVCNEVAYGASMVQDIVATKYDGLGRVWQQTRPYRSGDPQQWYVNTYDTLDRLTKTCTTINGQLETLTERFYDNDAPAPSVTSPNTKGNTIRNKDAWGRERWARFDWADRLSEVVEPDATGSGAVATNGTLTTYSYDVLNNLVQVDQNVVSGVAEQTRKFKYDALNGGHFFQVGSKEPKRPVNIGGK